MPLPLAAVVAAVAVPVVAIGVAVNRNRKRKKITKKTPGNEILDEMKKKGLIAAGYVNPDPDFKAIPVDMAPKGGHVYSGAINIRNPVKALEVGDFFIKRQRTVPVVPDAIQITGIGDLLAAANLFSVMMMSESTPTAGNLKVMKSIWSRVVFASPKAKNDFIYEIAKRISNIQGAFSDNMPVKGGGIFGDAEHLWQLPRMNFKRLLNELRVFSAADFMFELTGLISVHAMMSKKRGNKSVLRDIFKSASKIAAKMGKDVAIKGVPSDKDLGSAGSDFIDKVIGEAMGYLDSLINAKDNEKAIYAKVRGLLNNYASAVPRQPENKYAPKTLAPPLYTINKGYAIDVPKGQTDGIPGELGIWAQRAYHDLKVTWQTSGLLPGMGLKAYGLGSTRYAFSLDSDQDVAGSDWLQVEV